MNPAPRRQPAGGGDQRKKTHQEGEEETTSQHLRFPSHVSCTAAPCYQNIIQFLDHSSDHVNYWYRESDYEKSDDHYPQSSEVVAYVHLLI